MDYIGLFSSQELAKKCKKYGTLFTWTPDGYEIIIYYDKEIPYMSHMFAISVELTHTYDAYDLFEYVSSSNDEIEVKAEITYFTQFLLSYRNGILSNPFIKKWIEKK